MKLSIIIVNYNVKFFLEQCLYTVRKAIVATNEIYGENSCEVYVVDNDSADGSCSMLKEKFNDIILIENKKNVGFSTANNQAIRISNGEYVLLLNPDTVVQEDTFYKVIEFMDSHPDAGALGVKMIDGAGKFLPESKRALPTPSVSFYKIFGLSRLFPKSKIFAKYHLGYLDNEKIHEIDVLSGAFMFMRKKTLDKAGLLDEAFFMYGEDIDLSYRITLAGYKNYYFPETTIIHYKGESTKKGSLNYVFIFYNAMIIFANKHFSKKNAKIFSFFINLAVWFRATLSILKRVFKAVALPITDAVVFFSGFYFLKPYWEAYRFPSGGTYPDEYLFLAVPSYIIIWTISLLLSGGYEKPVKQSNFIKGILYGTVSILVLYSLLSEQYRFSRALLLIGSAWGFMATYTIRKIFSVIKLKEFGFKLKDKKNVIILSSKKEAKIINDVLIKTNLGYKVLGIVSPKVGNADTVYIGDISKIKEIIKINKADELIFSLQDLGSQKIIELMLNMSDLNLEFKIAHQESLTVIGSNSMHTPGELYTINIDSISKKANVKKKRLFDVVISLSLIAILPLIILFVSSKINFIKNIFSVLLGKLSWVGYVGNIDEKQEQLPKIKRGILNPLDLKTNNMEIPYSNYKINMLYAKNYKIIKDLLIIYYSYNKLGRLV